MAARIPPTRSGRPSARLKGSMRSGTFTLSACTIVQRRGQPLEGAYSMGLLTKGPTHEGLRAEELVAEGYSRQPVHFEPPAEFSEIVRSGGRVSFGEIAPLGAEITRAAIFDDKGNLVAYGLISAAPGQVASTELAFAPGAIGVRF